MAVRAVLPRHIGLLHQATVYFQKPQCRQYLSSAYRCEEAWKERLKHPLVKDVKPGDYVYDLNQKYQHEGKISAIDVDVFLNGIHESKSDIFVRDVEDVVHWLRRSRECVHTLPSTHHAVMRYLLHAAATETILKLLSDPLNYGIFLDHYTSNLLMDNFLQQKNYTAAARVASFLMLQEDFGPPLTQTLALASCFSYATCEKNLLWEDYTPKIEEPEEEVKIRVRYLRNPYFDDHFDLKEPNHIVGKTLAWLSPLVGGTVGVSCEVLGWALYNKWSGLEAALHRARESDNSVAASMVSRVKEIIESCEDEEVKGQLKVAISQLEGVEGKVKEMEVWQAIENLLSRVTTEAEHRDIQTQVDLYKTWEKKREQEFQRQLDAYRKRELLAEIEEKKQDLAGKEEVIFFFDNQEKLELLLPRKKYYPKRRSLIYPRKKQKKVDEGYIPPEV